LYESSYWRINFPIISTIDVKEYFLKNLLFTYGTYNLTKGKTKERKEKIGHALTPYPKCPKTSFLLFGVCLKLNKIL